MVSRSYDAGYLDGRKNLKPLSGVPEYETGYRDARRHFLIEKTMEFAILAVIVFSVGVLLANAVANLVEVPV